MAMIKDTLGEFKKFVLERNALDMALGIVLGVSFGKVVSSFVDDVITPPIGFIVGGSTFPNLKIILKAATSDQHEVAVMYGHFLQTIIDFLLVALAAFVIIKCINTLTHAKKGQMIDWSKYVEKGKFEKGK